LLLIEIEEQRDEEDILILLGMHKKKEFPIDTFFWNKYCIFTFL
jgi:hypothetical protein